MVSTATAGYVRQHASSARSATAPRAGAKIHPAVRALRFLLLTPFVLMGPEIVSGVRGRPGAMAHLTSSGADVLGSGAFLLFALMLAVTPLTTLTGWRWHVALRRDFGIAMAAVALLDLIISAVATSTRFPGGFVTRVTGHSFLAVGTLATLLCVPLLLTANNSAQRALGKYWKPLHRTTYVVWAAIVLHLLLLFGLHDAALHSLEVSAPLVLLRIPPVRSWCGAGRKGRTHRFARAALGGVAAALLLIGLVPFVQDFINSGSHAFIQQPVD